jgi:type I restriction enzyme, S subunit
LPCRPTAIIAEPTQLDAEYLYWCLRSHESRTLRQGVKRGATVHSLHSGYIESLPIPLAPLEEQRRIVDILNRANGIRRLRRNALDKARQLIPALFVDMFGDPAANPKGWDQVRFGDLVTYSKYGPRFPSRPYSAHGPRILRTTDMLPDGTIQADQAPRLDVTADEMTKHALNPRTLLITRSGTIGRLGLFMGSEEPCIAGAYLIEFGLSDNVNEEFLLAFFITQHGQTSLMSGSRSMTLANLNAPTIKKIAVPLPPLALQVEFARRRAEIKATIAQQERMLEAGDQLVASLMARLFDGGISTTRAVA